MQFSPTIEIFRGDLEMKNVQSFTFTPTLEISVKVSREK